MEVVFSYRPEHEIKHLLNIEVLLSPGQSILNDPFRNEDQHSSGIDKYSMTYKNDEKKFIKTLFLSLGTYHYLFKVTTTNEAWLTLGDSKYKTVLGSGRSVNYVEVGAMSPRSNHSFSDCLPSPLDETSPLLNGSKKVKTSPKKVIENEKHKSKMCCCAAPATSS